jgi:transcription elongation factor Elf1
MAHPSCPRCYCGAFELTEAKVKGAKYKLYFVQCGTCGAVVGTEPYLSVVSLVERLEKKVDLVLEQRETRDEAAPER